MPRPMTSARTPVLSTSSRSAGWTPGRCCGGNRPLSRAAGAVLSACLCKRSTHVGPGLPPVPGPAASRPHLAVLVAGGASLHPHVAPGQGADLRRRHRGVTTCWRASRRFLTAKMNYTVNVLLKIAPLSQPAGTETLLCLKHMINDD